jgi:hypothetical protein
MPPPDSRRVQCDAQERLEFEMLSEDPILRTYAGRVAVVAAGPSACVLQMHHEAEGHRSVVSAVAGRTVLQRMLAKQTSTMLSDFKSAAEQQQRRR